MTAFQDLCRTLPFNIGSAISHMVMARPDNLKHAAMHLRDEAQHNAPGVTFGKPIRSMASRLADETDTDTTLYSMLCEIADGRLSAETMLALVGDLERRLAK